MPACTRRREVGPDAEADEGEREVGLAASTSTSASRLNRIVNVSAPTSGWSPAHADAEERLLVANLDVAQGEEVDQLAVRPELAEPQRAASVRSARR